MASISDTVKVLKALGKDLNCPVHRAPLTEFILWMQKRGLINKPGEVMDVARLQAAGKEPSEGEGDERGRDGAEGTGGGAPVVCPVRPRASDSDKGAMEFGCAPPCVAPCLPGGPGPRGRPPGCEDAGVPSVSPSTLSAPPLVDSRRGETGLPPLPEDSWVADRGGGSEAGAVDALIRRFERLAADVEKTLSKVEGSARKAEAAAEQKTGSGLTDWTLIAKNCVLEGVSLGPSDGDGGIMVCPVTQGQQGRQWSPLDYKLFREWQKAVKEEGVNGVAARAILDVIWAAILLPFDCRQLARAVFTAPQMVL